MVFRLHLPFLRKAIHEAGTTLPFDLGILGQRFHQPRRNRLVRHFDELFPFFDHMLTALSKHSLIDMEIKADGDTHIDVHHTVEDTSIVLVLTETVSFITVL